MKRIRNLAVLACLAVLQSLTFSQTPSAAKIAPAQAASNDGKTATVCGKVVDAIAGKYGVGNHGFPITMSLDKPNAEAVFHAVLFSPSRLDSKQAKATYEGKQVCVTGKITKLQDVPTILATDPSQFQLQTPNKN